MIPTQMMKQRLLWFYVLLGGALSWLIHLMATYAIGEFACIAQGQWFKWAGLSSTNWLIYLISAVCLILSIGAIVLSVRLDKSDPGNKFLRKFGGFVNLLFSIAIAAQTVPNIVFAGDC